MTSTSIRTPQLLAMLLACTVAPLLAYNMVSTSPTLNQLAALIGWGLVLITMGASPVDWRGGPAVWALTLLFAAPWLSWLFAGLTLDLVLSYSGLLGAALLLLMVGQGMRSAETRQAWFEALCWGLLMAGLLCVAVSVIQVFLPAWADDDLIARSSIAGRAIGNLRQPNHLASQLIWACVAAVFLADQGRLSLGSKRQPLLLLLLFGFAFALVLSASRGGMAMLFVLAFWALVDRSLSRATRTALLLTPLMWLLSWGAMAGWAQLGAHDFSAASRLAEGAGSPKRLQYLASAWELLKQYPLTGVGWGEFNFAMTMAVLPGRASSFVDHTHNLVAQLLVELGWPAGLLVLSLLGAALWRAFSLGRKEMAESALQSARLRRCALMLVGAILLQGMLEFQLWYAYFLLPAAFAFGIALWRPDSTAQALESGKAGSSRPLPMAGLLMIGLSLCVFFDYLRVVAIAVPPPNGMSLEHRILQAQQQAIFFSAQADYAAATYFAPGPEALQAARRSAHAFSDAQLMIAWANSLAITGDIDRARYVAQRLREFNRAEAKEWLALCDAQNAMPSSKPFHCEAPKRAYTYQEMR